MGSLAPVLLAAVFVTLFSLDLTKSAKPAPEKKAEGSISLVVDKNLTIKISEDKKS